MGRNSIQRLENPRAITQWLGDVGLSYRPGIAASVRGPLLTLATAILFDVLSRYGLAIQPFPVMILTVVYAALVAGRGPGSISALITTVYAVHFFSDRMGYLRYDVAGAAGLLATAASAWITAFVVAQAGRNAIPAPVRELTHEEGDAIRRRLSLLEHASALLASSLDYESTLGRMARVLVPALGDWCTIHLATESGRLRFVAGAHRDMGREMVVRGLAEYGDGRPPFGVPDTVADAYPLDDRSLEVHAEDADHLRLYRLLAPKVAVRAPIPVRGETVGVLTLVMAESGREVGPDDVELVGELASRISLAIENAMLHREASLADQRFQVLFAGNPRPMWVFDPDTLEFMAVNDAAVRQYGYSADEFAGMTIMDLVPKQDPVMPMVPVERGDVRRGVAFARQQRKDGTMVDMELISHEVELDGRQGRLVIASDMSEQTRALASLHQAEEQLRHSERMEVVGKIGIGVAHDFNDLLTTIRGFADLLSRELENGDPRRGGVERILQATERGTLLTRQLLAFGDRQPMLPEPVSLNGIVLEMEGLIRHLAGDDVAVETRLAERLGFVEIDPGRLGQAIVSLVLSARQAMPDGGTMTIETSERYMGGVPAGRHLPSGPYAILAISDTGSGLDADPLSRTSDRRDSEDLGLRVVNTIVRQGKGLVRITTEPGEGRTVKVYLPLTDANEPAPKHGITPSGTETVLVVDDEEPIRDLITRMLSEAGYRTLEAGDGREALRASERHQGPIDLLVTDVVMPGMSGGELARTLEASRPDLEVLYISGYAEGEVLRRGVTRAEDVVLNKPFRGDDLLRKARQLLDQRTA